MHGGPGEAFRLPHQPKHITTIVVFVNSSFQTNAWRLSSRSARQRSRGFLRVLFSAIDPGGSPGFRPSSRAMPSTRGRLGRRARTFSVFSVNERSPCPFFSTCHNRTSARSHALNVGCPGGASSGTGSGQQPCATVFWTLRSREKARMKCGWLHGERMRMTVLNEGNKPGIKFLGSPRHSGCRSHKRLMAPSGSSRSRGRGDGHCSCSGKRNVNFVDRLAVVCTNVCQQDLMGTASAAGRGASWCRQRNQAAGRVLSGDFSALLVGNQAHFAAPARAEVVFRALRVRSVCMRSGSCSGERMQLERVVLTV